MGRNGKERDETSIVGVEMKALAGESKAWSAARAACGEHHLSPPPPLHPRYHCDSEGGGKGGGASGERETERTNRGVD